MVLVTHLVVEKQSGKTGRVRCSHPHPPHSCHRNDRSPQRNAQYQFAILLKENINITDE